MTSVELVVPVSSGIESAPELLQIGLVESDPLRALGYRSVLEQTQELSVVEAEPEALLRYPDIAVWLVGNVDGLPAKQQLEVWRRARPDLKLLVVGRGGTDADILRALSAGAKGYVDESANLQEFAAAVRIVAEGSVWAPRRLLSQLLESVLQRPEQAERKPSLELTEREREVLKLLMDGLSNKEIGATVRIQERTVKAHVAKLLRKAGVPNRIALTMFVIHHGLIEG